MQTITSQRVNRQSARIALADSHLTAQEQTYRAWEDNHPRAFEQTIVSRSMSRQIPQSASAWADKYLRAHGHAHNKWADDHLTAHEQAHSKWADNQLTAHEQTVTSQRMGRQSPHSAWADDYLTAHEQAHSKWADDQLTAHEQTVTSQRMRRQSPHSAWTDNHITAHEQTHSEWVDDHLTAHKQTVTSQRMGRQSPHSAWADTLGLASIPLHPPPAWPGWARGSGWPGPTPSCTHIRDPSSRFNLIHPRYSNPILYTAWLDNHALTLKSDTAKNYFGEKSSFLHTLLKIYCKSRKI